MAEKSVEVTSGYLWRRESNISLQIRVKRKLSTGKMLVKVGKIKYRLKDETKWNPFPVSVIDKCQNWIMKDMSTYGLEETCSFDTMSRVNSEKGNVFDAIFHFEIVCITNGEHQSMEVQLKNGEWEKNKAQEVSV